MCVCSTFRFSISSGIMYVFIQPSNLVFLQILAGIIYAILDYLYHEMMILMLLIVEGGYGSSWRVGSILWETRCRNGG